MRLDVSTLLSAYNSYYKLLQTHVCEDFSPRTPGTLVGGAVISRFGDGGRRQVMVNAVFHGKFWHRIKKCKEKKRASGNHIAAKDGNFSSAPHWNHRKSAENSHVFIFV